MDQVKIGKFIACRRKEANLTQLQLAEQLHVTDRAVSKWETGRSMPDSALMLDLCRILKISVNDLLTGEVISMDHYNEEQEQNLLAVIRQKEQADKRLLTIELVIGVLCLLVMLPLFAIATFVSMPDWLRIVLIVIGIAPALVAAPFMLRIEQTTGYYECRHCHHKYVPSYSAVFFAMHFGRTRYLKCPNCLRRSWHKKVTN